MRSTAVNYSKSLADALKRALEYVGEDGVEKGERYQHLGDEITKLWNESPAQVKHIVKGLVALGGCVGLAYAVGKTSLISGGTATAGWVTWLGTPTGRATIERTCGVAVIVATGIAIGNSDNSGDKASAAPTRADVLEAQQRRARREISKQELEDIQRRYDCSQGNGRFWPKLGCNFQQKDSTPSVNNDAKKDTPAPTVTDVKEAERRRERGEISKQELEDIQRRHDCANGNGRFWPTLGCG